ncbi:MAG: MBOAT family O-acyltransferase [Kiritimatiellia bacterium]|jgi:D-alanyl-lipoteichoic acid acyltransferase DltB (MBOAT superfamily)|nr:MBOAT family O-acyltransferase [Kiritimatiellia bacterium]
MLFPTTVFAFFFGLVFLGHWALARHPRARKVFLLCASLFFYGFWSWKFALMLLGSALVNHAVALRLERMAEASAPPRSRRRLLTLIVALNLGLLGFFKYTGFLVADVLFPLLRPIGAAIGPEAVWALVRAQEEIYPWISRIVLPVGISFFTFQALSYVVDVYRRRTPPAQSWLDFANYLAFFPQLVAGPIVRAANLVPQMERMPGRAAPIEASRAMVLILAGLFKKIVVANWLASHLADPVFAWPEMYSGPDILLAVYAYAVQIYCDFSAYSDIAIGSALLLGFHFPANFNAPYAATTLQDFWRRWHMSLSSWLRDYLYIPLGGSQRGVGRTYVNLLLTFLLGGLWHGAAWTFLLWGAFHGLYLTAERAVRGWLGGADSAAGMPSKVGAWLGRIWIFHVVCFSWILFRGGKVETASAMLQGIGAWRSSVADITLWARVPLIMVIIGLATQLFDGDRLWTHLHRLNSLPAWALGAAGAAVLTIILALGPEGVAPFIYFQF